MLIKVSYPQCHARAEVPAAAAGKSGRCRECGSIVVVPAPVTGAKVCAHCGADVAQVERFKDASGKYACVPCWNKRLARHQHDQLDVIPLATSDEEDLLFCEACNGRFLPKHLRDHDGHVLCRECVQTASAQTRQPSKGVSPGVFWLCSNAAAVAGMVLLGLGGFYEDAWRGVTLSSGSPVCGWVVYGLAVAAGVALLWVAWFAGSKASTAKPWNAVRRISLILACLWTTFGIYVVVTQGIWTKHFVDPRTSVDRTNEQFVLNDVFTFLPAPLAAMWAASFTKAPKT